MAAMSLISDERAWAKDNETKNKLIENAIRKEFETHITNIKNIFEENMSVNSKPYKIIEYLNTKMEELFGYKSKAERYQSQTEMLLKEQKRPILVLLLKF